MHVLDASALLAYLNNEPGGDAVQSALDRGTAAMSAVNAAEVISVLLRRGWVERNAVQIVSQGPWSIESVDAALGVRAGILNAATRAVGLSMGDCLCLALAEREAWPVLTADRAWAALNLGVTVELIR